MPTPRKSRISLDTAPNEHDVSRCVCRTFLLGVVDSKDFSHRCYAIVARLVELTQLFCVDISANAVMSNHFHLVVQIQKQRALNLSMIDVARRYSSLY
jgi:putative transposase